MHNLAELLQVMSQHGTLSKKQAKEYADEGLELQERILELMGADEDTVADATNSDGASGAEINEGKAAITHTTPVEPPVTFNNPPSKDKTKQKKDGTKFVTRKKKDHK